MLLLLIYILLDEVLVKEDFRIYEIIVAKYTSVTEDLTFVYKEISSLNTVESGYFVDVYEGKSTTIGIPETYNGKKVIGIVEGAFAKMERIDAISFPNTITKQTNIKNAFIGNYNGNCDVIETIEVYAEYTANLPKYLRQNVVNLHIYEGETIPTKAFSGSKELKNLILEEGLKTIEVQAFNSCTSLKDLVFPSSLETVKNNAFEGANATVIVFTKPSNLKTVQSAAFNSIGSCEKLYYGYKNSPDDWKSINIEKSFANLDDGFTNTSVFIPY